MRMDGRHFFSDINILNLCNMSWIKVTNYGDHFINRAGHHIAIKNS